MDPAATASQPDPQMGSTGFESQGNKVVATYAEHSASGPEACSLCGWRPRRKAGTPHLFRQRATRPPAVSQAPGVDSDPNLDAVSFAG